MLLIDISSSNNFGSSSCSKRELMAELGSVLAFSAVRNNDKVGLILFTDEIELYIPPDKGRSHILRVIRDILYFQPGGSRTNLALPLEFIGKVIKRRAVVFLISDFFVSIDPDHYLSELQPTLKICNRHHDLISMVISDPREHELPDCGWLTLEDSESGQQIKLNTSDPAIRNGWAELHRDFNNKLHQTFGSAGIDSLDLSTDKPYIVELLSFFGTRKRRRAR